VVEAGRPLTSDQIADARTLAADADLSLEFRQPGVVREDDGGSRSPRARSWRSGSSP
jgi:hypothetical protein